MASTKRNRPFRVGLLLLTTRFSVLGLNRSQLRLTTALTRQHSDKAPLKLDAASMMWSMD